MTKRIQLYFAIAEFYLAKNDPRISGWKSRYFATEQEAVDFLEKEEGVERFARGRVDRGDLSLTAKAIIAFHTSYGGIGTSMSSALTNCETLQVIGETR